MKEVIRFNKTLSNSVFAAALIQLASGDRKTLKAGQRLVVRDVPATWREHHKVLRIVVQTKVYKPLAVKYFYDGGDRMVNEKDQIPFLKYFVMMYGDLMEKDWFLVRPVIVKLLQDDRDFLRYLAQRGKKLYGEKETTNDTKETT